jgi:hypothetical protein
MHHQGKFRAPEFSEILFGLRTITSERLRTSRGIPVPTVISYPMGEDAQEVMAATTRSREDHLLRALVQTPEASQASLATTLGWVMRDGKPYKVLVALEAAKLIKKERDGYVLTAAGEKAYTNLKPASSRQSDD